MKQAKGCSLSGQPMSSSSLEASMWRSKRQCNAGFSCESRICHRLSPASCVSSQVEALVLCPDATLQRVMAMHAAPWFRAYSLLQRCCPRLDLATYVERCSSLTEPGQQLVRSFVCSNMHST